MFAKLSLTGHEVIPGDLQACHHLKQKETVIVTFKSRKQKQKILIDRTGLEKLGFLVNQTLCSSKQVQEHVVPLVILCSWRYEVQVFASPCTSPCTKWNRLCKEKCLNKFKYSVFSVFLFSDSIILVENVTTCSWNDCE